MRNHLFLIRTLPFFFLGGGTFLLAPRTTLAQATLNQTADETHYRTGLELFDKQKYGAAQQAFEAYIRLATQSGTPNLKVADAQYYAGVCALYLYYPDAETRIERFIADYPQHPKAQFAYYELGGFYFAKKDYNKALEYFAKVDADQLDRSQRTEMKFKLAYTHFSKQDFAKADPLFDELKRSSHPYTSAANYYAGYSNYKRGQYEEALTDLKKAEKDPAYQAEVPYMVANVYYKQQRYDELLAYTESALAGSEAGASSGGAPAKTLKNADELSLLTAEAYYRKGDYDKAAPFFKQYASPGRKAKPSPEVQYRIGHSYYLTKDYAEAANAFKSIASSKDTLGQYAAYYLGMSYLQTNNKPFALTAFDQARQGKANRQVQEEASFNHVKVLYELGNNAEAITALKEFRKSYPKSPHESEASELLSEAYLNSNNYAEAIAHIESIPTPTPRTQAAYQRVTYNQGVTSFNNERFTEAVPLFDKSVRNPVDGGLVLAAHFWKGEAHSAGRQFEEAIASYATVFRRAEEGAKSTVDDYVLKSRYGIAYAYYNRKEYEKALVHFREYTTRLQNAPNKLYYQDAVVRLADCYYVTKDYAEAVRHYDLAIAQNIADKDYAYYQKGIILGIQGKDAEAKKALDNAAQFPKSRYADGALFQKADLTLKKGDYAEAVAQFSQLIEKRPGSPFVPFALQQRAIGYGNLQQYDKAVADYQRILDNYGKSPVASKAIVGLQEALTNAGRPEDFNNALAKYKQNNPQDSALENVEFEAAKSLYFGEKYQQAVAAFGNYLRTYPANALAYDAKFYLGESYYRLNDRPNALKYHQQVVAEKRSPNAARSVTRLAEMEFAAQNYPNAINYYLTSLSTARNKKEQGVAWNGLMESYYHLSQYDSARFYADEIITKGSATVNAQNKALLYRGKSYYAQKQYDQAVDELLRTVNSAKDENGAEAQYLIGEALYQQKKHKESLDALFELNQKFGSYENWRGRGFLLIADNYVALDEVFQAKATLTSVIERSPDKAVVEEAKAKLKALEEKG
ncbi:MAG: tetratricopeptide repeat protein [Ferruginibacter sp.]|nr:tetratricopeptide repeat protein [Cytophagales bacterium]